MDKSEDDVESNLSLHDKLAASARDAVTDDLATIGRSDKVSEWYMIVWFKTLNLLSVLLLLPLLLLQLPLLSVSPSDCVLVHSSNRAFLLSAVGTNTLCSTEWLYLHVLLSR